MLSVWRRRSLVISVALSIFICMSFAAPLASASRGGKISNPEVAAKRLYSAWKANNRRAARKVASAAAVNQLFQKRWSKPDMKFMGCENRAGGYDCSYYYEGGALSMRVEGGASAGYHVESIKYIAD